MKQIILFLSLGLFAQSAFGFAGVWRVDSSEIPHPITDVRTYVYNMAKLPGGEADCGDVQCFRVKVVVNGLEVGVWPVSPGKRHPNTAHVGAFTPIYNERPIYAIYGRDYVSYKYKYKMPYVMYVAKNQAGTKISNIGFHTGYRVNGKQLSHGCLRLLEEDAADLNSWMREAKRNGGNAYITTRDTQERFGKETIKKPKSEISPAAQKALLNGTGGLY